MIFHELSYHISLSDELENMLTQRAILY